MPSLIEITNVHEHDAFIETNPRAIIFFGSYDCGHCRAIYPTCEKLVNLYPQIAFSHVEVTQVKTENVEGVPVFVGYKNGEFVDTVVGASEKQLLNLIDKLQ